METYQASELVGKSVAELKELLEVFNAISIDEKLNAAARKQATEQSHLIGRELDLRHFSAKPTQESTVFLQKDKTGIAGLKNQIKSSRGGRG